MKIDKLDRSRRPTKKQTDESLARLLTDIGTVLDDQQKINANFLAQFAEVNLKLRYIMETFKYEKPSLLVGAPKEVRTLYDIYMSGDRERFLSKLKGLIDESLPSNGAGPAATDDHRASADGRSADDHPPAKIIHLIG